jgi:hypothetical protein
MPSLRDVQRAFSAATLFGDDAALAAIGAHPAGAAARPRIAVYRNTVRGNYRRALAATYPVVSQLVGTAFFNTAVDHFVQAHASTRGDINGYGGDFALFLSSYAPARGLTYLPDVARLEWAVDQSALAADTPSLDLALLARVPAEAMPDLRFTLHPSVRLLHSLFPLLEIWRVHQPGWQGEIAVDLSAGGDALRVQRQDDGVAIERIGRGEHALLTTLQAGATLSVAGERAIAIDPVFDLGGALRRFVTECTLTGFRLPPPNQGDRS